MAPAPAPPAHHQHDHGPHDPAELDAALAGVGPRIRACRKEQDITLAALSEATGISISTLSRLESGGRRPNLDLLLPVARALHTSLDDLVGPVSTADPRIHGRPVKRGDTTVVPLSPNATGIQAFKQIFPGRPTPRTPDLRTHDGYEWLYVLSGRLRLVVAEHDLVLGPGEVAEVDTRVPHWFDAAGPDPVEVLTLFGPQGERMHVRARPRPT